MHTSTEAEYQDRHSHFTNEVARGRRRDARVALYRGGIFLVGLAIFVSWWGTGKPSPGWLVLPLIVFCGVVVYHQPVLARLARAERGTAYYRRGLDRLAGRWEKIGPAGERYRDATHPHSSDLDLFGTGSLFQRLWCGVTRLGEDRLADWLLHSADIKTIGLRQAAVAELRPRHDLREKLGLLEPVDGDGNQNLLRAWAGVPPRPIETPIRLTSFALTAAFLVAFVLWLGGVVPATWMIIAYLACLMLSLAYRRRIGDALGRLDQAESGLAPLHAVTRIVEGEQFSSAALQEILKRLSTDGEHCSRRIEELRRLTHRFDSTIRNQFFAIFAVALGLPIHLAHAAELWRMRYGSHVPRWLEAIGEFEALLSMGGYSAEHPDDPFPEVAEGPARIEATALGHPLLPNDQCVRNDVRLGTEPRLLVISGSNMAGKSTLLRAVGVNAVLALAGAPVRAKALTLTPLQLGTVIRVSDSLQSGKSFFFATIERLQRIASLADGSPALLFLLDELLAGTNSHDRRIGAEEILRRLLNRGAIGIVTTHDLALTEIADVLAPAATNFHFRDELIGNRMHFDYTLRPGRVTRGNAVALMRLVGLMAPGETVLESAK